MTSGLPSALAVAATRNCWPTGSGAGGPASPGDDRASPGDEGTGTGGVCAEWLVPGRYAATAEAARARAATTASIRLVLARRSARTVPPSSRPAFALGDGGA